MGLDKNSIRTQGETEEAAPIDQVEERVDAKMKKIEGEAKEMVAHGLQDKRLEREARRLQDEADQELNDSGKKKAS